MTSKQALLAIITLTLLVSICFVPLVLSDDSSVSSPLTEAISPFQTVEPDNISVSLLSPVYNATITDDFNTSFVYVPAINGTDKFYSASLIVNGSVVASNQTALTAYQNNTIAYTFPSNGTYLWNIRLGNSTHTVMASNDFNMTVAVAPPNSIGVTLKAPDNGTTVKNDFNCSFVFVPTLSGTDKLKSAALIVNGSVVASNQTTLTSDQNNTIYYKFTANGTYTWNVQLQNSTNTVTAPSNYNFTVAVYVAPSPTPTPAPTATPTPGPTSTASPTPTPAPTENSWYGTWLIVIIAVFVICGVLVVVLLLLRRRH